MSTGININYHYSFDDSPARDQVRTLKFVLALLGRGEMVITDKDGGRPELRQETEEQEPGEGLLGLLELLENVVVIEDWIAERIDLPDHIDTEDARRAALFAAVIKKRSMPVRWESARAEMPAESVAELKSGKEIKIVQDIGGILFGREVPLVLVEALPELDAPVGMLMSERRVLLCAGSEERAPPLCRSYRLLVGGLPAMLISERFPALWR